MNRKFLVALLLASFVTATPLWAQSSQIVAVRAGHLFDSKSGQMLSNQVVLINGDKTFAPLIAFRFHPEPESSTSARRPSCPVSSMPIRTSTAA